MPDRPSIRKDIHVPILDARCRRCHLRCVVAWPTAHVPARPAASICHVRRHGVGARAHRPLGLGNAVVCRLGHAAVPLLVAWQGAGIFGLIVCLYCRLCRNRAQRRDRAFALRLPGRSLCRSALSGAGGALPRVWRQACHAFLSAGGDWPHRHFHRLDPGKLRYC